MKVIQINALYAKLSTGRTTREMHEYLQSVGVMSYVASPDLAGLRENCFQIGSTFDHKLHAFLCRLTGKQGYYSYFATRKLLAWMNGIKPDIVILRNLHSNFLNLPLLARYLADNDIATVLVLHDSWFLTGGCTYYIQSNCKGWLSDCSHCPLDSRNLNSWFLKPTRQILKERRTLLGSIPRLSIVGVSKWVADDAKKSVLKNSQNIQHIYNWIDQTVFFPKDKSHLRKKYGYAAQYIVLGVSAGWSAMKGIDVFHGLAEILPSNYKIILIGDSATIENKKENITYLSRTSNMEQLADMYAMADVFINPTIQETFGKTTAEALSCGIPVVAYNSTATPELVGTDGACGILLNSLDPSEYADSIYTICENKCVDYNTNCRNRSVQLFNMESNLEKYMTLFLDMQKKLDDGKH